MFVLTSPLLQFPPLKVRVLVDVDSSPQPYAPGQSPEDVMSSQNSPMDGNALVCDK